MKGGRERRGYAGLTTPRREQERKENKEEKSKEPKLTTPGREREKKRE